MGKRALRTGHIYYFYFFCLFILSK